MPPRGALSDKLGNLYEAKLAVTRVFDLIDDLRDVVRLRYEEPGVHDFEGWVQQADGSREFTQVKRQLFKDTEWKIGQLVSSGILGEFGRKLGDDERSKCVFYSMLSASHLLELTQSARMAKSLLEFETVFVAAADKGASWKVVCKAWPHLSADEAWLRLKRIRARTIDQSSLDDLLFARARALVKGDPANVIARLDLFLGEHLSVELTETDVWDFLCDAAGFEPTDWYRNESLHTTIRDSTGRYRANVANDRSALAEIPRRAAKSIADMLRAPDGPAVVTVVAGAGMGKTAVLGQVLQLLEQGDAQGKHPLILAARLDRLPEFHDGPSLGHVMRLPGSPAAVLSRVAGGDPAVLVLDQLDAFGAGSGRKPMLLDAVAEVVRDALKLGVRVLLACREFDVEMDPSISSLIGITSRAQVETGHQVERLAELTPEGVREVLEAAGVAPNSVPQPLHKVLRTPLHLQMLVTLHDRGQLDAGGISTHWQLFDKFYSMVCSEVENHQAGANVTAVSDRLALVLSEHQELSAPLVKLQEHRTTVDHMARAGWLRRDGMRIAFAHEAFFDYTYATWHMREDRSLLEMLCQGEQHLFRRAQVRQILALEREQDHDLYLREIRAVLTSNKVRVHIKDLVIALIVRVSDPTMEEWNALCSLGDVTKDPLAQRAHSSAARQPTFGTFLVQQGVVAAYLADAETADCGAALCRLLVNEHCEEIVTLLEPHVGEEDWSIRIAGVIQVGKLSNNERLVDLLVKVLDAGVYDHSLAQIGDQHDIFMNLYGLSGNRAAWGARILGAALRRRLALITAKATECEPALEVHREQPDGADLKELIRQVIERRIADQEKELLLDSKAAKDILSTLSADDPVAFVHEVLPPVRAAAQASRTGSIGDHGEESVALGRSFRQDRQLDPTAILVTRLTAAIEEAARRGDTATHEAVREMIKSPLALDQFLVGSALAAGHPDLLHDAVAWLISAPYALCQGWSDDSHGVSIAVLTVVCHQLPAEQTVEVQQRASSYEPAYEQRDPQLRGKTASRFLHAIPDAKLSDHAREQKTVLDAKFPSAASPKRERATRGDIFGSTECSPVPIGMLATMGNSELIDAMLAHTNEQLRYLDDGRIIGGATTLAETIARQLNRDPERLVDLLETLPTAVAPPYRAELLGGLYHANPNTDQALRAARAVRPYAAVYKSHLARLLNLAVANGSAGSLLPDTADELVALLQEVLA